MAATVPTPDDPTSSTSLHPGIKSIIEALHRLHKNKKKCLFSWSGEKKKVDGDSYNFICKHFLQQTVHSVGATSGDAWTPSICVFLHALTAVLY